MSKKNAIIVSSVIAVTLIIWFLFEIDKRDKKIKSLEKDRLKRFNDDLDNHKEISDSIKRQVRFLAQKYRNVNPKTAFELTKILSLTEIGDSKIAVSSLIDFIDSLLRERYENDIVFKQWVNGNKNSNYFKSLELVEFANQIELFSSKELEIIYSLNAFRNDQLHSRDSDIELLMSNFISGIELILRLDKFNKTKLFTIGYGDKSTDQFIRHLKKYQVNYLIDVRSVPMSKFNPQYNRSDLQGLLYINGISYEFMGDLLGGRPNDPSCYIEGKVDYQQIQTKSFFKQGIENVKSKLTKDHRIALMCSEGKPQDCHRTKLIGKQFLDLGLDIAHIDEHGKLKTQEETMLLVTKGRNGIDLFGENNLTTSRKKYL